MTVKYQLKYDEDGKVTQIYRPEDRAWIPLDEKNIDYVDYLKWVEEGNQPEPYQPEDYV